MIGALTIDEITFFHESFVTDTIQTFVFSFFNVAVLEASTPELLGSCFVMSVGGANEMQIGVEVEFHF